MQGSDEMARRRIKVQKNSDDETRSVWARRRAERITLFLTCL